MIRRGFVVVVALLLLAMGSVGASAQPSSKDPGLPEQARGPSLPGQLRHAEVPPPFRDGGELPAPLRDRATSSSPLTSLDGAEASSDRCEIVEDTTLSEQMGCSDLIVTGNGVVLDLNGLTVGDVVVLGDGATVRNGTVHAQGLGIAIYVVGEDVLLERLTVQNGDGFVVESGPRTTVRDSTFVDNGGIALSQYYASGLRVERSTFLRNGSGISVQSGNDATIAGNRFADNVTGVNLWDEDSYGVNDTTIRGNRFEGNEVGIRISGGVEVNDTVVERNRVRDSATSGILVASTGGPLPGGFFDDEPTRGGAAGTVIRGNHVTGSGGGGKWVEFCDWNSWPLSCTSTSADDGITVLAVDPVVLPTILVEKNHAMKNAGYGIEAPGVTDGGKNLARKNGESGCLGVACRP